MNYSKEIDMKSDNSNDKRYDVIVCGGGPSGVAAALSASRQGLKTLLVERYGFCGGMSTAALVNPWCGHEFTDPQTGRHGSIIGGIFKEVVQWLNDRGGYGSYLSPAAFDDELLKHAYDMILLASDVDILYHSYLKLAHVEHGRVKAIELFSKGGTAVYTAEYFIDCSGDGDLAAMAGVPFEVGRRKDGLTQAMTVSFRLANVNKDEMLATRNIRKARALVEPYFQAALRSRELHYPYRPFIHFYDYPRPGILHFNMTRINRVSGLSVEDLTKAEIEGRRQAFLISNWLIKNVPYFKDAFLEKVACQVGVRETRHIIGKYRVEQGDITTAKKFHDGIARSRYFIDIHNPTGAHDVQQKHGTQGALNKSFGPPDGDYYEIPYRSLIADGFPNLIVACRALSASHEASAAIRVMATMHGIGEAAGIAVNIAKEQDAAVNEVDGRLIKSRIDYMNEGADFDELWNAECGFPWTDSAVH